MIHHYATSMCICMLGGDPSSYCHDFFVPHAIDACCVGRVMMSHCYLHMASRQYIDDIFLISCFHACAMSCELFMPTICVHDMISMIPSSTLHLRTTSLFDLIAMIACYVASPMFHSYSLSLVDDIYAHASDMIYLDNYLLSQLVSFFTSTCIECNHTVLIDLGDFDTLLVMHACLIEPIAFGCSRIICLHTMQYSLVLSYDEHDAYTCWVSYHTNDRFCTSANLICFSECLSCSFVLKESQGITVMRHIGYVKAYMMCITNIFDILIKVNSIPLSHPQVRILDGSFFHCCFLLLVYMIHILDGGPTLKIGSMDLHIEERSHLLYAPSKLHSCDDIELWYINTPLSFCTTTSIFVDCASSCHARWAYHTHHKFAPYAWID